MEGERTAIEQESASLSVKLLLPTGLCMLPAFVFLGILPSVMAFVDELGGDAARWSVKNAARYVCHPHNVWMTRRIVDNSAAFDHIARKPDGGRA